MSSLINRLVQQFRSKSQYDHFIRESLQKFDINTYRFQQITPSMARKSYNQLHQKYEQHLLVEIQRNWHQNQRKVFVWFLLAFLKYLKDNHQNIQQQHWQELSETFFNKDIIFLKYQYNTIQKNRRRQQWTEEEDEIMRSCQEHVQNANWNEIAKQIFFKTQGQSYKSSKQCRQRWQNHLDNRIKKQSWQIQQDLMILKYVSQNGKKWSKIVQTMKNTRTQHMVKNRFKSLLTKCESQLKIQKKQLETTQNDIILQIIAQLTQRNLPQIQQNTRQSIQIASQIKDVIKNEQNQQQQQQQIKLNNNGQKRSHGIILRGQNGQFINETQSVRSSQQAFNIFQCHSPATLSLGSSGFIFSSSFSSFTPPSITINNQNQNNITFGSFQQRWINKVQQKSSINSDIGSNRTTNLIQCSRRQDNLRFSFQFNSLQSGCDYNNRGNIYQNNGNNLLSTPIIKAIQNSSLLGNNINNCSKNPLQSSQYYISTLDSSLVLGKQQQQKDEIANEQKGNFYNKD